MGIIGVVLTLCGFIIGGLIGFMVVLSEARRQMAAGGGQIYREPKPQEEKREANA